MVDTRLKDFLESFYQKGLKGKPGRREVSWAYTDRLPASLTWREGEVSRPDKLTPSRTAQRKGCLAQGGVGASEEPEPSVTLDPREISIDRS